MTNVTNSAGNNEDDKYRRKNLEAMGQLAAGLAHNINNTLAAVVGHIELCIVEGKEKDIPVECLDRLESALRVSFNASELCSSVLSFAGKGRSESSLLDINEMCRRMIKLVKIGVDSGIRVVSAIDAVQPFVVAPAGIIENAVLNIALNGRDALPNGGILHISTDNVLVEHGRVNQFGFVPQSGMHTVITVSDTGIGMSDTVMSRIFEPFFTTKGDRGSGIGLYTVKDALHKVNGFIEVVSAPKQGTQFSIYLKSAEKPSCETQKNSSRALSVKKGGRVLVIDDEEVILEVVRGMLSHLGYDCTICSDPREAISLYRHCWRNYSLVFFDLCMPLLRGIECWNAIRRINPTARLVVTSGYGMVTDAERILRSGNASFIEKPFQMCHIEEAIEKSMTMNDILL